MRFEAVCHHKRRTIQNEPSGLCHILAVPLNLVCQVTDWLFSVLKIRHQGFRQLVLLQSATDVLVNKDFLALMIVGTEATHAEA